MNNAERRAAALEVRMLELVVEALEDVRPALVRRIEAGAEAPGGEDSAYFALSELAVEAAVKFERVVTAHLQNGAADAA